MTIIPAPPAGRLWLAVLFCLLPASLLLAGCGGGHSPHPGTAQWTVFVYLDADNDLEQFGIADMNEMEMVGSSPQVNIVAQIDRIANNDTSNGNWTGCRRYLIKRDNDASHINSTLLQDLGEVNMADPQTLADFLNWGKAHYPAKNYALILWNHGSGWRRPTRGVIYDDTSYAFMTIPQLRGALEGESVNLIAFDACLMQMAEVAYELRNCASVMVGSEEEEPAEGYPYNLVLQPLVDNPAMTPSAFATTIVNKTMDRMTDRFVATQSAMDLSKVAPIATAADLLARALSANSSTYASQIASARDASQHYTLYDEYKDAYDFAEKVKAAAPAPDIVVAADYLTSAITSATILERHWGASVAGSHGLSIAIPTAADYQADYQDVYSQLAFAQDTAWDEWLQGITPQALWTVMVFLNADNDLEQYGIADMNEMEAVGSTPQVNIVVQMDRTPGYDASNGDWTDCRRYLVQHDTDTVNITSPLLQDLGEVDMGNPAVLHDFVQWAQLHYPAQHYLLDFWNHGSGWLDRSRVAAKAISFDDTSSTWITTPQLPSALQGLPLDIVAFDACLMQMAEVAYEIRGSASIMVGSEEEEPPAGYPYDLILQPLVDDAAMSPAELASTIVNQTVDSYPGGPKVTQSAIDLSKMSAVASAADQLALALKSNVSNYPSQIAFARDAAQAYKFPENKDAYDFAQLIHDNVPPAGVTTAATALMSAITDAVIVERHWGSAVNRSHGLAIYVPAPSSFLSSYLSLAFAQSTSWDEFLTSQNG